MTRLTDFLQHSATHWVTLCTCLTTCFWVHSCNETEMYTAGFGSDNTYTLSSHEAKIFQDVYGECEE